MMMMDKTASTSQLAPKTANRQFFQWAAKWFYANASETTFTRPDIPTIICLLQAIGFKLREFQKSELITGDDKLTNENIQIKMECGTSNMIAILEMDEVKCECPDINVAKDGSFWSITGTGPISASIDNINKIDETGSNLLPDVSKEITSVVREVTYKLFRMINNKDDVNSINSDMSIATLAANSTITKNTEIREGLIRSYTDIDDSNYKPRTMAKMTSNLAGTRFSSSKSIIKESLTSLKPKLQRQGTYELDEKNESIDEPRPSPPKLASSPVFQHLCSSLGQISLQSDDEMYSLADYVVKAHQILDKAVTHIIKKLPTNISSSSIHEDGPFVKPEPPPLSNSSFSISSPLNKTSNTSAMNRSTSSVNSSRPGSACSLPSRTTPLSGRHPTIQKPVARRSTGLTSLLANTRDRSASFGTTQRPVPNKNLALAANARRRSTTAVSATSSFAQRSTATNASSASKLPSSKLGQTRTPSSLNTGDRMVLSAKRRISPDCTKSPAPRSNVSLIKPPMSTSKFSTSMSSATSSKFGFSTTKK